MHSGIIDKIPYDQKIIDVAHLLNDGQFVIKLRQKLLMRIGITAEQSLMAELIEICPRIVPVGHIKMRQLRHTELDFHMTSVRDLLRILQSLQRIREQLLHFLFRLDIVLPALIAHTILIRKLLSGLNAEQDIVRLPVLRIGIMHVICSH